ncbi:MAG: DNA repair protein RecN [Acidobacteriota bacterium]|jgi:DNA repair protein RecN (Recombination protein N)|nr:DNA repair protein RecN [Acidobacteriota bacterium]
MLSFLKVENFAVVQAARLDFSPGLNVLTGETGAGKSILIGALNMLLQRKTPAAAIRDGAERLVVEALFQQDGKELALRREVGKRKSICFVNGSMVPFDQLQEQAQACLDIYGQNEHVFLLNPLNHALYLDDFSGNAAVLAKLAVAGAELKRRLEEREELRRRKQGMDERLDFLAFRVNEIEELDLRPGDDEELERRARILGSAEEILTRSGRLTTQLYEGENAIYNQVTDVLRDLRFLQEIYGELQPFLQDVEQFSGMIPDLSKQISAVAGQVEYDEAELNQVEEKLMRIRRLKSKYDTDLDGLLQRLEEMRAERERLIHMDMSLRDCDRLIKEALDQYRLVLDELRLRRRERAAELGSIMEEELSRLELPHSRFEVRISEAEVTEQTASERGPDRVEFYFSSNPGQSPARVREVASGGELSRLMLALKSLRDEGRTGTSIFDEIDTGIGGKTAEFVGEKLKRISRKGQVLCISHLPQIAAFADRHFLVEKRFEDSRTYSDVRVLDHDEQIRELARLMAGSAVNNDVIRAAENLRSQRRS